MKNSSLMRSIGLVAIFLAFAVASAWGQAAKNEIRIGMSLPLSGLGAPWGIQSLQSGEMLADEINAAGGIEVDGKKKKIKVIAYDDKYDGSIGLKNTNRLIHQDKVDVVVYQSGDVPTVCRDICKQAGVLVWGTAYVKDQPSPAYPYIFAKHMRYPETVNSCYKWFAKNRPEIKRIAYMAPKEARTQTCVEVLESTAASLGLKVVSKELFESGTEDFNAVLLRILKEKPDIIDVTSSFTHESGIIAKQARGLGYKGPIFHACQAELASVIEIAGAENAEGFISGIEVGDPLPPKLKEIEQRYQKKYRAPFPSGFFQYWAGTETLLGAIKKARSVDAKKVAQVMQTSQFDVIVGKTWFCGKAFYGINNQIMMKIPVAIVKGGKVKQLAWLDGNCAGE